MRITLLFSFLIIAKNILSQNLIFNSSFEDINICTEFEAPCSPEAWRLTSSNLPIYQTYANNHFVGILIYNSSVFNVRSYLQSRLADTLILGERYKVSLDLKPNNLLINKIGILFSDTLVHNKSDVLLNIKPDIEFIDNIKLLQYKNGKQWLHLENEFTANSKSLFIIIGNFCSDNSMIKRKLKGKIEPFRNYYYFIDNIQIVSINKLHQVKNIQKVKKTIYSLHFRHPTPDTLFALKKNDLFNLNKLASKIISNKFDTILLYSDLLFTFDNYEPSKYLIERVDSIFKNIKSPIDSIVVVGNTDNIGSVNYNNDLSFKRAETVANHIRDIVCIQKEKLIFYGEGSRFPIASDSTPEGRYKNRRVVIIIKYEKRK